MKRNEEENVEEILRASLPSVSAQYAESVGNRVLEELQSGPSRVLKRTFMNFKPSSRLDSRWGRALALAAAIAIVILIPITMLRNAPAVFEDSAGSRRIQFGEVVHSTDGAGSTLVLADTSRVEMRAKSELSLERADDGVRIQLRSGDIIVNAAKQHGHLYVQTKDVTVSVVGTVFLVKAEAEGSRVAVIEGEVHVQQGTTETKLHPGEQVASNPKMETIPVKDEVAWSKEAITHVALLQQATAPAVSQAPKGLRFEVASIRPNNRANRVPGARGGGANPAGNGCGGFGGAQVDPRRFVIANTSLYHLIVLAYPEWAQPHGRCAGVIDANLLSGGEGWLKSDLWDIQALIPEDTPSYTGREFDQGKAPELAEMLQTLLAERFKLTFRRESKEIPVYFLTVAKGGPKFNGPPLGRDGKPKVFVHDEPDGTLTRSEAPGKGSFLGVTNQNNGSPYHAWTANISMQEWVASLFSFAKRPVLDRTGLTGEFIFHLETDESGITRLPLVKAIEEIGLKLEDGKASIEVWVIERAEKPSEN